MSYTLFDWGVFNEKGEELSGGFKSYAEAFVEAARLAALDVDYSVFYKTFLFGQNVTVTLPKSASKIVVGRLHDFGGGASFRFKYKFNRSTLKRAYEEMKGGEIK